MCHFAPSFAKDLFVTVSNELKVTTDVEVKASAILHYEQFKSQTIFFLGSHVQQRGYSVDECLIGTYISPNMLNSAEEVQKVLISQNMVYQWQQEEEYENSWWVCMQDREISPEG